MKNMAIHTVVAIAIAAVAFPAFAVQGSGGGRGKGNGACANCQNHTATTKPACDGTGPKGPGAGTQRPMDGSGRQHRGGAGNQQPTWTQPQTEQTPPTAN